ncbi:MAG: class I SAM-dependent methyltransferase [Anaerolineae bacterium]
MTDEQQSMYEWYVRFYRATASSKTHAEYCERVYGRNLCQQGYTTLKQLDDLLALAKLNSDSSVLDVGCGNGMIAEYLSDTSGAHVHGIDYAAEAIEQAQARTASKRERLSFAAGDMNTVELPALAYDAIIALDTLYFGDLEALIRRLLGALKAGGQLLAFYTLILWNEQDDRQTLLPERTPLGEVLTKLGCNFQTWDYARAEYERSQVSLAVAAELKAAFEAEGHLFLWENRQQEGEGSVRFYEQGRFSRYLYQVRVP